jgi:hypothetical protein
MLSCGGRVIDLHFTVSHRQPKLIAIEGIYLVAGAKLSILKLVP